MIVEDFPNSKGHSPLKQPVYNSYMAKMYNGVKKENGVAYKDVAKGKGENVVTDLDAFFSTLPSCLSKEKIDNFAVKFLTTYNTIEAEEKLIKTLCDVESLSFDIIPFYARIVATVDSVFPEITHSVCTFLKKELNYYIKKKEKLKADILPKLKILKFVVALIELRIFFDDKALFDFKSFLSAYKRHWSEFYSNDIGRLLKLATSIIMRYTNMIENDFLQIENPQLKLKFISKLIFKDLLIPGDELRIVQIIRMLNWDDPEVSNYAIKCLSSAWEVEFNDIEKFACLVSELSHDFRNVGVEVANSVLNLVQVDTDLNSTNYKRRLSTIKYLGELYNFGLIESVTIFDTLYFIIMSGFNPKLISLCPSDPPRSLIRLRSVLLLIKTCGDYLNSSDKTKLAQFFTYFQHYYWMKKSSPVWGHNSFTFPTGIHEMLLKCVQKYCPNVLLCNSYQEASEALNALKEKIVPTTDPKNSPNYASYFPGFDMHKICYEGEDISYQEIKESNL